MIDIYGTIGPACSDPEILKTMFREGMTGLRLNTSHVSLQEAADQVMMIHEAAAACGIKAKLLIDMQGPELRIGKIAPMDLKAGDRVSFASKAVHGSNSVGLIAGGKNTDSVLGSLHVENPAVFVDDFVLDALKPDMEVLLDDGKILLSINEDKTATVIRGGILKGGKSIALVSSDLKPPAMTEQDYRNLKDAKEYGVTGVMQPFVRDAEDLRQVREFLDVNGGEEIKILAKIENLSGVTNLESFFPLADEIVIARGDLGNAVPLWELPRIQKNIEARCREAGMPFMVVTQMLASMEHSAVPTRAEVSDIYNAVCDGASSVMVTGETAVGEYPIEVIRYLAKTAHS